MWEFDNSRPIYMQITEQIKLQIISGAYQPGEKLNPVRELASMASVNPNTMQKALGDLEREGLVFTQRTLGRFITEDKAVISNIKIGIAAEQIDIFLGKMHKMGYSKKDVIDLLGSVKEDKGE